MTSIGRQCETVLASADAATFGERLAVGCELVATHPPAQLRRLPCLQNLHCRRGRRNRGCIVPARRSSFSDQRGSIRREQDRESARSHTWVHHNWTESAVDLNVKAVDVIGDLFRDEKKLAVGAERQRGCS